MNSRRRSTARIANFAAVVLFAAAAAFLLIRALLPGDESQPDIVVPQLVGSSEAAAMAALEAKGLRGRFAAPIDDSMVAEGHVADQEPDAGSVVRGAALVTMNPSSGRPSLTVVPDVRGTDLPSARATLTAAGLATGAIDTTRDTTMAGRIAASRPMPGAQLHRGATVSLSVSTGPASISVPDVVGLTADAAATLLDSVGLRPGRVRSVDGGRAGIVQGQRPATGTMVVRGAEVELTVGGGTP